MKIQGFKNVPTDATALRVKLNKIKLNSGKNMFTARIRSGLNVGLLLAYYPAKSSHMV